MNNALDVLNFSRTLSRTNGGIFFAMKGLYEAFCSNFGGNILLYGRQDRFSGCDNIAGTDKKSIITLTKFLKGQNICLHLHGLWSVYSFAAYVCKRKHMNIPYVISPHGMLDAVALSYSSLKKKFAMALYERSNLNKADCLHALCEAEYQSIRELGFSNPVAVISNGINIPDITKKSDWPFREKWKNKKILLYLGRLHHKKGVANVIDAWAKIQSRFHGWRFAVVGPSENGYDKHLHGLIRKYDLHEYVDVLGAKYGGDKESCYINADAFILPSYSEGLPMTVFEALSYGLPVIYSENCNLNSNCGVGIKINVNIDCIAGALEKIFTCNIDEKEKMCSAAIAYAQKYSWISRAQMMRDVYLWLLGKADKPECVYCA